MPQTFKNINVQHPLPTDGDQVYEKDIDQTRMSSSGFTGGTVIDLFNDSITTITNTSSDNPKVIKVVTKRPIQTNILGITTASGNFSNTKIISKVGLGVDQYEVVIYSATTDNTDRTLLIPSIEPITFTELEFQFHTTDPVSI